MNTHITTETDKPKSEQDPTTLLAGHLDYTRAIALISDEQTVAEMLDMLLESFKADLPALHTAAQGMDWQQVAELLHRLKGILPLFCDEASSKLLTDLEPEFRALSKTQAISSDSSAVALSNLDRLIVRLSSFSKDAQKWLDDRFKHA